MKRIKDLEKILENKHLDGLLIIKDSNIRYITGFTSSESYAIVSPKGRAFITDSRYTEQAQREVINFDIVKWRSPSAGLPETIKMLSDKFGIKRLGFERNSVSFELYEKLKNALEGIDLIGTSGLVEAIRIIKDEKELEYMRKAAHFADEAFTQILNYVKIGISEKDIERELQYITKKTGADDIGFPAIIASGKNSSMPHAVPSHKLVEDGDFITFDMGAIYKGYRSDMTRTIVVGHASDRQKEVYELVKLSQEASINTVKAGVDGKIPHFTAIDVMKNAGSEGIFEYGVGHGVGLDIHEDPFMSARCEYKLETGNVITVEPGIYIPGWGGIRIEDTVIVKDDGCEILTRSSKELIII